MTSIARSGGDYEGKKEAKRKNHEPHKNPALPPRKIPRLNGRTATLPGQRPNIPGVQIRIPHPSQAPPTHEKATIRRATPRPAHPAGVAIICTIRLLAAGWVRGGYAVTLHEVVEVVVDVVLVRQFYGAFLAVYICCGGARTWEYLGGWGAGGAYPAATGLAPCWRGLAAILWLC